MISFCKCGSIIINDKCSNKTCGEKYEVQTVKTSSESKKGRTVSSKALPKENKTSRVKRASKCITYSLDELEKKENVKY